VGDWLQSAWAGRLEGCVISEVTVDGLEMLFVEQRNAHFFDSKATTDCRLNSLTPELNPSAQRCLTRFLTGGFAS
jgi:hypothetical protein